MKCKKKSKLELAQEKAQAAINKTNESIEELGNHTSSLYDSLTSIQDLFDQIRNVPTDKKLQYEELKKIRLNWKQQAEKIEKDYQAAAVKNAGAGAAGAGLGVAVVTMGPTVAMGVATTFGVASTGTAISALSGAAATNAALAWLGGGALAVGGGGIPVIKTDRIELLEGVEAVIDKDRSASLLAKEIGADILLILTAVDKVYLNYNTDKQISLDTITVSEAEEYINEGHFAKGSMLPKVEACMDFVKDSDDKIAIISSLEKANDAINGNTGTVIKRRK